MGSARRLWRRGDALLILLLLAAALALWLHSAWGSRGARECQILYEGEVVVSVVLAENRVFSIEALPHIVFEVRDGRVAFIESDCPDQVCVRTGFIGTPGQSAVCLPNRAAARIISSGGSDEVDAVA